MLFCPNVAQTNAFSMDILIKPLAFTDGEPAVYFSQKKLTPYVSLSSSPLLLNVLMVGRTFRSLK